jgi:hypothetical protein
MVMIILWIKKESNGILRRVGGERALAPGLKDTSSEIRIITAN